MWAPEHREKVRRVARALRPWFDPKSRRPLVVLFAVSMGVFLRPLAFDVGSALFFMLPRWFHRALGQAAFLPVVAVGLWRLGRVGPTDSWPTGSERDGTGVDKAEDRWVPWALRMAVASLIFPILRHADGGMGFADWDYFLDHFEAVRRTILEWGQFPWWHPWCRGGFPLAAGPQIGAVSMATPLVLAFGSTTGLGLSAVLCLLIAVEGAYRLARLWSREPWSAAVAALVYGLNGGVIIDTSWGYFIPMSYCSLPWLAYHAFRIGDRFADGLALGFWLAFAVMNGLQYPSLYAVLLASAIWLRAARIQPPGGRSRLMIHTMAAVGLFLASCGVRLVTVLLVMRDDERRRLSSWDVSPIAVIHHLLDRPILDWPATMTQHDWAAYIETTSYVGPVVVLLAIASLTRGWRWWHTLTLVGAWFALGSTRWYHPSYWTSDWPIFASTHVVTRWRFVTLMGLGLASGSELARWRRSSGRAARAAAVLLAVVIAADLISLGHQQLPRAFSIRLDPHSCPGPAVPDIVNIREGMGYPCVLRGYGVIQGYEPMLGGYWRDAPTLRRAREDPDYRGEAWTGAGAVRPVFWSPNRIVFRVAPGQEVFVNQNPGSWWRVNGRPAFPGRRCAEPLLPFVVRADASGRIELRIHPPGLEPGIGLHLAGLVLLAAAWLARRRLQGPVTSRPGLTTGPVTWQNGPGMPVPPIRLRGHGVFP